MLCEVTATKFIFSKKKKLDLSELSPNVNSLDIVKKTLAENLTEKLVLFSALSLEVWTLCLDLTFLHLISLFFTCLRVLISSSSLLVDFFSRCIFTSLFCFKRVSSYHRATSLVCFRCVTLCHQICFVLLCADVCKICQLLLHNILHIHVLQHHMLHSSKSSLGCPSFCRLTIDMIHENYFMTQFLQKMFRHQSFGNSSRQGV